MCHFHIFLCKDPRGDAVFDVKMIQECSESLEQHYVAGVLFSVGEDTDI